MARKKVFGIAGSNKEVFGIAGSNKEVFGFTDLGEKVEIGTLPSAVQEGSKIQIGTTSTIITAGTKIEIGYVNNSQDLSSLSIMGEWENIQFVNEPVDTTGVYTAANYGDYFSRLVEPTLSRNTWGNTPGEQSITFSYTEEGITVSTTATVNINKKLTGLTVSGDWVTQFYNNPVDTTGLSFMANYEYGSPESITPDTISPSVWGGTGSQFATFSYSENGITVSASKEASVVKKLTGLIIGGDWVKAQFVNNIINTTGLSFVASYNDGSGDFVSPSVTPITWGNTVGTQAATFTYGENGITVSASKDANVVRKLISLNVYGSWSNPQYTNTAVDTTGLIFTANYEDGFTASVTPSVSPSTWSSTVGTQTATFSYSENGISVSASKDASVVVPHNWSSWKNVGGIIFYVDPSATGSYEFKNSSGTAVSAPSVGTDCTDWTYRYALDDYNLDKYYVYNTSAIFKSNERAGTQTDPWITWTYLDQTNQSWISGKSSTPSPLNPLPSGKQEWEYYGYYGRVYESLDGTYTNTAIGTGKTNTSNMLSLRNGVYIQGSQINYKSSNMYAETIWYICDKFNKGTYSLNGSSVPNNTGCNDWYIPSKDELETMKNTIGASTFASILVYSGGNSAWPWSSSADSHVGRAWNWSWSAGKDYEMRNVDRRQVNNVPCLALSRSF